MIPPYLSDLVTGGPVTPAWAKSVHDRIRATPRSVRAAYRASRPPAVPVDPGPAKAATARVPVGKGEVSLALAGWWRGANDGSAALTAVIRLAARTFPDISRADGVATLVSLGVNPSTASIQWKKGLDTSGG